MMGIGISLIEETGFSLIYRIQPLVIISVVKGAYERFAVAVSFESLYNTLIV